MENQSTNAISFDYAARLAKANKMVKYYTLGGVGVGAIPFPLVDIGALIALQLKMLHGLATLYNTPFKRELARSAVASLLSSAVPVHYASPVAISLARMIPIVGQGLAYATLPVFAGATSYAIGRVFIQHFESGGTFLTFDPEKVKTYYSEELSAGRQLAEEMNSEEVDKVTVQVKTTASAETEDNSPKAEAATETPSETNSADSQTTDSPVTTPLSEQPSAQNEEPSQSTVPQTKQAEATKPQDDDTSMPQTNGNVSVANDRQESTEETPLKKTT